MSVLFAAPLESCLIPSPSLLFEWRLWKWRSLIPVIVATLFFAVRVSSTPCFLLPMVRRFSIVDQYSAYRTSPECWPVALLSRLPCSSRSAIWTGPAGVVALVFQLSVTSTPEWVLVLWKLAEEPLATLITVWSAQAGPHPM